MTRHKGSITFVVGTCLLALAVFAHAAPAQRLTKEQAETVERNAIQVEQACLHNDAILQNVTNVSVRTMLQWGMDPRVCACQAKMIRDVTTPEVFAMNESEVKQYYFNANMTRGAECMVPVLKEKFATSCEQLFSDIEDEKTVPESARKRMKEAGYANPHAFVASACTCIRSAVKDVTPKDWVNGSLAAYHAYLERKRTGNNDIKAPPGPFDAAMAGCMAQLVPQKPDRTGSPENQASPK